MPRPPTVLITGTDSRVGKTWIACALAGALRRGGRSIAAVKPVETGCDDGPASLEDGVRLAQATGQRDPAPGRAGPRGREQHLGWWRAREIGNR